ncbi:GTP-binding protein Obg CgtA [Coniophora puteana RWD-64-598 SS2]|uniref:GTP-binding protein Obg CgtA n=1 Tax=Coniophora puteana (strain RWD-64-598) TaxID=741705 RepID=A0A5M3MKF0_CONPW|nr:GTP-binding protein Obg CgtA [Coniophora puteana RWD-64-598 SS2]EIW79708.1 GTP-binding protein Obg CgtA [Coniophora puteana RWD-64-598 SS2]
MLLNPCRHAFAGPSQRLFSSTCIRLKETGDKDTLLEEARRKRRTEWKRQQKGQSFLDHSIIHVRGGTGGNGCVAFHREKFLPNGPPSGGSGGRGGDVYIMPTPHLTSLSSVPKRVRGASGGHGQGTWQNGRNGTPTIVKVPLGTIVRELTPGDPRRAKDEYEAVEDALAGITDEAERRGRLRDMRWVHYPEHRDDNLGRDVFKQAEAAVRREERERRFARRQRMLFPVSLDLDRVEETVVPDDAPLGLSRPEYLGHRVAAGGMGGLGNPHFVSGLNRSPKFATRGYEGERVTLALELKILADIGLVGVPNAGKSTLLRALTGGRAKTEVASYAFTTLNPVVGVIRVGDDGSFEGELQGVKVFDETVVEEQREQEAREAIYADPAPSESFVEPASDSAIEANHEQEHEEPTPEEDETVPRTGSNFDILESFRFTIADNPGLISQASEDIGLGHSFLRSMERSLALVYVVDLSAPEPWAELAVLRDELDKYQSGMSGKARMVVANKADLLAGAADDPGAVEARAKLARLQEFVEREMGVVDERTGERTALEVVPVSAKFSQNLRRVVASMHGYVEEARRRNLETR